MSWTKLIENIDSVNGIATTIYFILFSTIFLFVFQLYQRQRKFSVLSKIPGPKPNFILGNALDLIGSRRTKYFKAVTGKFCDYPGGLSKVWIGFHPYCLIYGADEAEALLTSQKFLDKSADYKALVPWLGTGLLTSTGSKWHHRRKMLTPTFSFKILEDFIEIFNRQSLTLVEKLKDKCDGKPFDIFQFVGLCALDLILETAMGRSINAQNNVNSKYVQAIHEITDLVIQRQTRPWLRLDFLFRFSENAKRQKESLKILHGFTAETIKEKRIEFNQLKQQREGDKEEKDEVLGKKRRLAFLDLLLEQDEVLSDEDIQEEVDTFMFEGHDTTSASLNWTLYLLGRHPKIQDKVYEELEFIFGKSDRSSNPDDLRQMKYLECCIKESLRLFPSVPVFGRFLKKDLIIGGRVIPKGTSVLVITHRLHRDPIHFPEPNSFKPERFLAENCVKRHPFAYIPFSAGPRNCIGQKFALLEEKVVLSTLLRKYRVESTEAMEDLNLTGDLILRPEIETVLKLFPRV